MKILTHMKYFETVIFIIIFLPNCMMAQREYLDSLFVEANEQYASQSYAEAANNYSRILQQGYAHVNLFYNLGNAYYQLGQLGDAIWAYEKGLQLNPRDEDLRFNLKVANARIVDRVDIPEGFFLLEWYGALKRGFSQTQWLNFVSLFFLISAVLSVITRLVPERVRKLVQKMMITGLIITALSLVVFIDLYFDLLDVHEAIVTVQQGNAYSAPTEISNVAFVLHEGTKTRITQEQFPWVEIELIDGKKGWIKSDYLRRL